MYYIWCIAAQVVVVVGNRGCTDTSDPGVPAVIIEHAEASGTSAMWC